MTIDTIIAWAKRRGFVYPGSDIYGGLANARDYGPYGVQLKKNIHDLRWKTFVQKRQDIIGLDSQILMNPHVRQASGHVDGFQDPLFDCKKCKNRFRADKLIEEYMEQHEDVGQPNNRAGEGTPAADLLDYIYTHKIVCPQCGELDYTDIKYFNLMFKTHQGVTQDSANQIYLRPETAQGIFTNVRNILDTTRMRIPFGIAQVGKAFRNEINPGLFIYRTREFEQAEIEYLVHPDQSALLFEQWKEVNMQWRTDVLNISEDKMRARKLPQEEAAHYSAGTYDFEYKFPRGRGEIQAFNNRTDYDLKNHQDSSGTSMQYTDPKTGERYIPHTIELSWGLSRMTYIMMVDAYTEETYQDAKGNEQTRTVAKFPTAIAPVRYAIFPLVKKDVDQVRIAKELFNKLSDTYMCEYDEQGAIGKRYRRQDEIGTPTCITIDPQTVEDGTVTLRDRDTMKQERVGIEEIKG